MAGASPADSGQKHVHRVCIESGPSPHRPEDDNVRSGTISKRDRNRPSAADSSTSWGANIFTPQPGGTEKESMVTLTTRLFQAHKSMKACRGDVQVLHVQSKEAWERLQRYQQSCKESRRLFDMETDPMSARYNTSQSTHSLSLLRERMDDDQIRLHMQSETYRGLEQSLGQANERFSQTTDSFMSAASAFASLAGSGSMHDFLPQPSLAKDVLLGSDESSTSHFERLDPRLQLYYGKAVDVKTMGERLVNLYYWFQEAVVSREVKEDQGQILTPSNEEFEAEYMRKRKVIEQELDIAIAGADRLRTECEEANLSIDAWQQSGLDPDRAETHSVPKYDILTHESPAKFSTIEPFPLSQDALSSLRFPSAETVRSTSESESDEGTRQGQSNPQVDSWIEGLGTTLDVGHSVQKPWST